MSFVILQNEAATDYPEDYKKEHLPHVVDMTEHELNKFENVTSVPFYKAHYVISAAMLIAFTLLTLFTIWIMVCPFYRKPASMEKNEMQRINEP